MTVEDYINEQIPGRVEVKARVAIRRYLLEEFPDEVLAMEIDAFGGAIRSGIDEGIDEAMNDPQVQELIEARNN